MINQVSSLLKNTVGCGIAVLCCIQLANSESVNSIIGFEDSTSWKSTAGSMVLSNFATQGNHSLLIVPNNYTLYKSSPISMSGAIETATFDLYIPVNQPNPYWFGQAQMYIECPSQGIYNQYMGEVELTGKSTGGWNTLGFRSPQWVNNQLRGKTYNDLSFSIVINVPGSPGVYYLDNLQLSGLQSGTVYPVTYNEGIKAISNYALPNQAPITLSIKPTNPSDPMSVALAFFKSYKNDFGLTNPESEFALSSIVKDEGVYAELGKTHVKLQQMYNGMPVFNAEAIVQIDKSFNVIEMNGAVVPTPLVSGVPGIDKNTAKNLAIAWIKTNQPALPPAECADLVSLGIFTPSLFEIKTAGNTPVLAYKIITQSYETYLNAHDGSVLHSFPIVNSLLKTYDIQNDNENNISANISKYPVVTEVSICPANADRLACNVEDYLAVTENYYAINFSRNSDDNKGANLTAFARVVFNNGPNAYSSLHFSSGYCVLDVVGHEFTHRVTANTAKLAYQFESGALSEAFSDIFGALIEGNWQQSNGTGGVDRNLADPVLDGEPDHYSNFINVPMANDNGWVHGNSTIGGHIGYLLAKGGVSYNIPVQSIGDSKTAQLFYRALTTKLSSSSNFQSLAIALLSTAEEFNKNGLFLFNSSDVQQVIQAIYAVGIHGSVFVNSISKDYGISAPGISLNDFKAAFTTANDMLNPMNLRVAIWNSHDYIDGSNNVHLYNEGPATVSVAISDLNINYYTGGGSFSQPFLGNGKKLIVNVPVIGTNSAPVCDIISPANNASLVQNYLSNFEGSVTDINETIESKNVKWSLVHNVSGTTIQKTGLFRQISLPETGTWTVKLSVVDKSGSTFEKSITINVTPAGGPDELQVVLNSPLVDEDKGYYDCGNYGGGSLKINLNSSASGGTARRYFTWILIKDSQPLREYVFAGGWEMTSATLDIKDYFQVEPYGQGGKIVLEVNNDSRSGMATAILPFYIQKIIVR